MDAELGWAQLRVSVAGRAENGAVGIIGTAGTAACSSCSFYSSRCGGTLTHAASTVHAMHVLLQGWLRASLAGLGACGVDHV